MTNAIPGFHCLPHRLLQQADNRTIPHCGKQAVLMKRRNGHCAIPREGYSSSSAECACRAICMRSLLLIARAMAFFTSIG